MKSQSQRIAYAQRIITQNLETSRKFDGCFEMGDGDEVVMELIKRSESSPTLKANLPKYICKESIEKFTERKLDLIFS